jgi:hypothetical protein
MRVPRIRILKTGTVLDVEFFAAFCIVTKQNKMQTFFPLKQRFLILFINRPESPGHRDWYQQLFINEYWYRYKRITHGGGVYLACSQSEYDLVFTR